MTDNDWSGLKQQGWTWLDFLELARTCQRQLEIACIAGNGWKWLKWQEMSRNGWKCLEMAWLEMARSCLAGNGQKFPGWKWLEFFKLAGNSWKWPALLDMAENG